VVAALLGLAALMRLAAMFYESISLDDATVALMAKHVLQGENWPVFFYRESYMGSLNGFHMVPALFVFGPSVLLVRLHAIAWSLLFPLSLYVLARRLYGEVAARVTLLLAALPPFLVTYYSTVAEPHFETNTFGVILLLLALGVLGAPTEPAGTRILACLGFTAGLAAWTNVKIVVVLGPILLLLLVRDPRLPLRRGGWLLAGGFLVGSLPASLFYLLRPGSFHGGASSTGRLLEYNLDFSWARVSEFLTRAAPLVIGTYYWGPNTPLRLAALVLCASLYAAAVGIVVVEAVRDRCPGARRCVVWMLLLTLGATYAALYPSTLNILDDHTRGRYLLPACIPLFLFLGVAIDRVARRSRLAAGAALTFVLAFNVWTNVEFLWPLWPSQRAWRAGQIAIREALGRRLREARADAILVDKNATSFLWRFLLDRPVVSDLLSDNYYPATVHADAARRVAVLATPGDGDMAIQLAALGATATATQFGRQWLYEDIRVPNLTYRLVPRADWRALGEAAQPPAVGDGDLGTAWPPRRVDRSAAGELVLDLGARRSLARLVLWPTASTELIVPLEISGSLDAVTWERLGVVPDEVGRPAYTVGGRPVFRPRNGWLELSMTPRPVRYLRVRPAEPASIGEGMVGELFAYEAGSDPAAGELDVDALVQTLRHRRVRRLLADPVISARVDLETKGAVATLPANGALNSHGLEPPSFLVTQLRLRETDAALVPGEDAEELRQRLRAADLPVTAEPMGPYVLFQPAGRFITTDRCQRTDWRVVAKVAEADGRSARYVVDGRLRNTARMATIRLEHPRVSARHAVILKVRVSDDGRTWRLVPATHAVVEWAWAGRTLFAFSGGVTELAMGGVSGRAVEVELRLPYLGDGPITALCVRGVLARE
jgi:4-amino-4-deoxy-L-arabinose transferase-like glycosyltransferase